MLPNTCGETQERNIKKVGFHIAPPGSTTKLHGVSWGVFGSTLGPRQFSSAANFQLVGLDNQFPDGGFTSTRSMFTLRASGFNRLR